VHKLYNKTRKLCYRKDDRAVHPIYRLFHPNFIHAYTSIILRGFYSESNSDSSHWSDVDFERSQ